MGFRLKFELTVRKEQNSCQNSSRELAWLTSLRGQAFPALGASPEDATPNQTGSFAPGETKRERESGLASSHGRTAAGGTLCPPPRRRETNNGSSARARETPPIRDASASTAQSVRLTNGESRRKVPITKAPPKSAHQCPQRALADENTIGWKAQVSPPSRARRRKAVSSIAHRAVETWTALLLPPVHGRKCRKP